jgi:hypothetical protein
MTFAVSTARENLLDLPDVGAHRMQVRCERQRQLDVFSDQSLQDRGDAGDHAVEIEDRRLDDLLPAEGEQLARDGRRAERRALDFVNPVTDARIEGRQLQQQLAASADRGQQVVEVVRHAAGEAADRLHLLAAAQLLFNFRLAQRLFGTLAFGDVVRDAEDADRLAITIAAHTLGDEVGRHLTVADGHAFERFGGSAREYFAIVFDEVAGGLGGIDVEVALADDLAGRETDEARGGRVHENVAALEVLDENRVRRRIDDGAQDVVAVRTRGRLHAHNERKSEIGSFG